MTKKNPYLNCLASAYALMRAHGVCLLKDMRLERLLSRLIQIGLPAFVRVDNLFWGYIFGPGTDVGSPFSSINSVIAHKMDGVSQIV